MSKTYYSEYVNHCLRFYVRHGEQSSFRSEADKLNWFACDNAFKSFSAKDRELLMSVYKNGDTLSDGVYKTALSAGINQLSIWRLIKDVERKVAKRRGLL